MQKKFAKFFLLVVGFLFAATAYSQTSQGTLSGSVRDLSGAMVPQANVTLLNEGTGQGRI